MRKLSVAMIVAVFFAWCVPANAEQGTFEQLGAACGAEIENLCPKVAIGQGRILTCLEQNKEKLSVACEKARVNAKKLFEEQNPSN
jgi:hypothetical protein